MPAVHLVCGPVGAGKTTFAEELAAASGGVCFSIDDWMRTLYAADMPQPLQLDWMLARIDRCEALIWKLGRRLLDRGLDVILDLGFMRREHRDRFRALVAGSGFEARLHVVTADADTRRERVRARNRERTGTFRIEVDDATFDWAETWYQPPDADEQLRP